MLLAGLTLLSFFFTVKVLGIQANISVSETFVFTTVLLFGTAAPTVSVALDALIMSGWRYRREPFQVLFNATELALSILVATHLFFLIVKEPLRNIPRDAGFLQISVLVLSLTYFLLNGILTAATIGLQFGARVVSVLRSHFLWLALNYHGRSIRGVIDRSQFNYDSCHHYKYYFAPSGYHQFDLQVRRATQLNILSAIETSAMAVDAKE